MRQSMISRTLVGFLLVSIFASSATAQNANEAQPPAVFPPLTAGQQAAKQAIIDSINVSPAAQRPNIVLIFADDLGYADIGCFGSTEIPTPHIDALVSGGMKFTSAYVTAGTCSPSRAALLTGQYQHRFGFEFNTDIKVVERLGRGLDPAAVTIADVLAKAGYQTGAVGKWHLGTREQFHPLNRGFGSYYGFLRGGHSYLRLGEQLLVRGFEPVSEDEYLTDAFAREAVDFVNAQSDDTPFFLYVPFNAVHTPLQATENYRNRFSKVEDPRRRTYYAMTSAMDDAVGRIVEAIDAKGFSENTMVIFFNDNGGPLYTGVQSNGPLRMGKLFLFEGGVRVPLVIKWPAAVEGGSECDGIVSSLDMLPTFSSVAGATLPSSLNTDGVNLQPWLTAQRMGSPSETLFWRNGRNKAMRKGKWKMVEVPNHVWLFDLGEDVGERNNLAEKHPDVVRQLQREYRQWEATIKQPAWPPKARHPQETIDGVEYRVDV